MKTLRFNRNILTKPWLMGLISVACSLLIYSLFAPVLGIDDPEQGYPMAIGIPAVVAPLCTLLIGSYIKKIEAQKAALAELNAINKRLLSVLSHDLRAPITSLKGVIDLVETKTLDPRETEVFFQDISQRTGQLLTFMDQLLNWAENQRQLGAEELQVFNLQKSIEFTLNLFREHQESKGIRLKKDFSELQIKGAKDTFAFAFRNVYQNALKFTPQGGEIGITIREENHFALVSIKDSGIGMDPETIAKVRDSQTWYSKPGTQNEKGSGFGLSTAITYMQEAGGDLEIESVLGEGSTLTIKMPFSRV